MGMMLKAECGNCGYETIELFVGGGVKNFMERCAAPAFCARCREVVTANVKGQGPYNCDDCGAEVRIYGDPSLQGEILGEYPVFYWNIPDGDTFILPDAKYRCPRCKQLDLRFVHAGFWD